jgi:hypothetical protein
LPSIEISSRDGTSKRMNSRDNLPYHYFLFSGVAKSPTKPEELADQAEGNVYILDSLDDHATLIEIIHKERRSYQY